MMDCCSASNFMSLSKVTDKRNAEKLTLALHNKFMLMPVFRVFSIACSSRCSFNLVLFDQNRLFFANGGYVWSIWLFVRDCGFVSGFLDHPFINNDPHGKCFCRQCLVMFAFSPELKKTKNANSGSLNEKICNVFLANIVIGQIELLWAISIKS